MTDIEDLVRATLAEDGAGYPVSVGALSHLQERLAGTPEEQPRRLAHSARWGLAGGALVGVAAAIVVVLAFIGSGPKHPAPDVSLGNGPGPTTVVAPPPPASFSGGKKLGLDFTATRLLLGGPDVWAFGVDSAEHPWAARIHNQVVIKQRMLPSLVCSASIDNTDVIAVILQDGPDGPACTDRGGRGTLGLLDPTSLTMLSPTAPARGGDALVRPEGIYVVDAGVISLVNGSDLRSAGASTRLGDAGSVVNLAGDPNQQVIFATVYAPGHPTQLFFLRRTSLTLTRNNVNLAASLGAIPYATAKGAVWVSVDDSGSQAELHPATGPATYQAFEGSPEMANFAESGTKLWALDSDGTLRCASLTTGDLAGASKAPGPGVIAADTEDVYLAPDAHELDILTPSATCGG